MANPDALSRLPHLGAGLGHRREIHDSILAAADQIDFLEVITEKYISASSRALDTLAGLADRFTLVPHGVSLSVGTAAPVSKTFLRGVKTVCELVRAPYYSDHLAVTQSAGIDLGHLSPLPYNAHTLAGVVDNIGRVQDFLDLPFVLENITETHLMPGSTMDSADFLHQVVERTGCGLLLDVTNLYTNSVNLAFDPMEYARRLPLHAVVQVHLAGGIWSRGKLIDSHSAPVPRQVWDLFEALLPATRVKASLIERDDNYPDFAELLGELALARASMATHGASRIAA
jgi:uncharacterized protein